VVQYFERARFEHFPEYSGTPSEISLSRLGDSILRRQGINWQTLPRVTEVPEECLLFEEVGHSICPPFRATWERYGGLNGVGLPLTEAYDSVHPDDSQPYRVQYFERARLEYYPDRGAMEFGMLGREWVVQWGGMPE
jgi:hypothetical protein